jgi:hypothetical protein
VALYNRVFVFNQEAQRVLSENSNAYIGAAEWALRPCRSLRSKSFERVGLAEA